MWEKHLIMSQFRDFKALRNIKPPTCAKSYFKVKQMGAYYSCLHAFIHWHHTGAGLKNFIHWRHTGAGLKNFIHLRHGSFGSSVHAPHRPHSASMQKLSVPVQSTLQDDFATCVQKAKPFKANGDYSSEWNFIEGMNHFCTQKLLSTRNKKISDVE